MLDMVDMESGILDLNPEVSESTSESNSDHFVSYTIKKINSAFHN